MKSKTLSIILVLITFSMLSSCNNSSEKSSIDTPGTVQQSEPDLPAQSSSVSDDDAENVDRHEPYYAIDEFVNKFNSSSEQITDISEMDLQGNDYRTEYRLNAFKNAVGKKGNICDTVIEIINYGVWENNSIRFYINVDSLEKAINIYTAIVYILDDSLSHDEVDASCEELTNYNRLNIYLGQSGSISGYINLTYANGGPSGYEIMIDCTELNYL